MVACCLLSSAVTQGGCGGSPTLWLFEIPLSHFPPLMRVGSSPVADCFSFFSGVLGGVHWRKQMTYGLRQRWILWWSCSFVGDIVQSNFANESGWFLWWSCSCVASRKEKKNYAYVIIASHARLKRCHIAYKSYRNGTYFSPNFISKLNQHFKRVINGHYAVLIINWNCKARCMYNCKDVHKTSSLLLLFSTCPACLPLTTDLHSSFVRSQ